MKLSRILGVICLGLLGLAAGACFDQPAKQDPAKKQPDEGPREEYWVNKVLFFPDGKYILARGSRDVTIWNVETGKFVRTLEQTHSLGEGMAISPSGKRILLVSSPGSVGLWDADTGKRIIVDQGDGRFSAIHDCAISADGRMALTPGPITIWDLDNDALKVVRVLPEGAYSAAFSKDGKMVASVGEDGLKLWEIPAGKYLKTLKGGRGTNLGFTPDGKKIFKAFYGVAVWDLDSGKLLHEIAHTDEKPFLVICVSPDATLAVSAHGEESKVNVWNIVSRKIQCSLDGFKRVGRYPCAFSPDGKRVVASFESTFHVWDAQTGKKLQTFRAQMKK